MRRPGSSRARSSLSLNDILLSAQIDPEFENFFGKLFKKVGKVVKGVAKGIAKIGLGPILNKIKALIKPLLNQSPAKSDWQTSASRSANGPKTGGKIGICCAETSGTDDSSSQRQSGAGSDATLPPENVGAPVQAVAGSDTCHDANRSLTNRSRRPCWQQDEAELNMEVARLRSSSSADCGPRLRQSR